MSPSVEPSNGSNSNHSPTSSPCAPRSNPAVSNSALLKSDSHFEKPQLRTRLSQHKGSNLRNTRHAFHTTRKLYNSIALRTDSCKIFLSRNVKHAYSLATPAAVPTSSPLPSVLYTSVEPGVDWSSRVPHLRCLWCQKQFFRFKHPFQLLLHLKTSHGMLSYHITDHCASPIVVNVQLQRASLPRDDNFQVCTFEDLLVNRRRSTRVSMPSSTINKNNRNNNTNHNNINNNYKNNIKTEITLRSRPKRRLTPSLAFDEPLTSSISGDEWTDGPPRKRIPVSPASPDLSSPDYSPTRSGREAGSAFMRRNRQAKSKAKTRRTASKRVARGRPAFTSLEKACEEGTVFHSVIQNRLNKHQFEGDDSDEENELEKEWRFQLNCDRVAEYLDTIPIEKLFMNLWNQFVELEHRIDSDRAVAPACIAFGKRHGHTILKMSMEASFVRHLNQLVRIGLLDADCVFTILSNLRREEDDDENGEKGERGRFRFADYVLRQAEIEARRQAILDEDLAECDKELNVA